MPAAPQPERGSGLSRRLRITIIAVVLIVIVVVGIIGYAVTGLAYAQTRVGNADRTLNSVISHQNNLNNTFTDLNSKFNSLSSGTTFDPLQARQLFDQFVANEKAAGVTDVQDQASLVSTKATLTQQSWLTLIARSSLDKEAARIDHAEKALSIAKTTTDGYVQDGQFFQAYFDAQIDLEMFSTQVASADLSAARNTLTTMRGHVDTGLKLSSAPGLPAALHSVMVDLGTLVTDFGKLLDAAAANDDTAITSAENAVQADANKLATYNVDQIMAEIGAYYKPMFDQIDSEMAKAAA
jgi:type II secretory pathway pseudopilin PulG